MIITAHRGASGVAPENTIAALKQAIKDGADFAEIDIQESKDGKIILLHDHLLDRTTNGTGPVTNKNWHDLKELDAGSWFDTKFGGEKLPLLTDAIDVVKGNISLNIEIKTDLDNPDVVDKVIAIIHEKNYVNHCIITSFHHRIVEYVHNTDPHIKTGIIFENFSEPINKIFDSFYEILSFDYQLIGEKFIQQSHAHGKQVHVWTVNKENDMRKMIDFNVDSIITDYPSLLKELLQKTQKVCNGSD